MTRRHVTQDVRDYSRHLIAFFVSTHTWQEVIADQHAEEHHIPPICLTDYKSRTSKLLK
jgi:hypothetical protein